jgi:DeoR/GlpR family transcriptional regulator of sugar metabolism
LLGDRAVRSLNSWRFDAAFLGGEGMDAEGVTNSHDAIAAFQRAVLLRSSQSFFCLDVSKLGRATPHRVARWEKLGSLITDATTAQLAAAGIELQRDRLISAR